MAKDGASIAMELTRGLSTHIIKELLFNRGQCGCGRNGKEAQKATGISNGATAAVVAVPMES